MPIKESVPSAAAAVAEPETPSKTRAASQYTKWDIFDKAGLRPTIIRCDVLPGHPADESCKTNLIPGASAMLRHMDMEHGGGFLITVKEVAPQTKKSEPSAWPGWSELRTAGAEIQFLRCEVCDALLNQSVRELRTHLKPHRGKFRGAYQAFKNMFLFNIQFTSPAAVGDDADESWDA